MLVLIAYLNRDYRPCGAGPHILGAGESYSCGGFDPYPWLYTGLALAVLSMIAYAVARRAGSTK